MEDFFYHFNQVGTFVQGLESSKELTSLLQNFCSFSNFFVNSRTAKEMETKNSASELQNSSLEKAGLLSKGDPFPENRSELRSISNVAFCRDKNIAAETNPPNFSEESFFDACSSFLSSSLASVVNGNKTLLQMAGEYRSQHPGKWIADEEERKKRLGGSSSKIEKINTFLDSYYERQVQLEEEKKEKEERFKWEVSTGPEPKKKKYVRSSGYQNGVANKNTINVFNLKLSKAASIRPDNRCNIDVR